MSSTYFSIIIACYNGEPYLKECLDSVLGQHYPAGFFEAVCVDDGSTDSSPDILKDYQQKYPNLRVLTQANAGLEKACNAGIRAARFDRVVRVDADDIMDLDFLTRMDEMIRKDPNYDFYYCRDYVEYYSPVKQFPKTLPEFSKEEVFGRGDFFATGTVYQKQDLERTGLFPEGEKNCGLENYSVILSLLTLGKRGLAVPHASFYYRRHETNMSTVKRTAIIEYGKRLLKGYGRRFVTNQYHPYGLKSSDIPA